MPRDEARTIKVRCATWDQVEAFYTEKLKGDTLVVKMPVKPELGDGVTLALGLPSGLVFAIDGSVTQVGRGDPAGKHPVALKLHGLTASVRDRLARLVADGRAGLLSSISAVPQPAGEEGGAGAAPGSQSGPVRRKRPSTEPGPGGGEPVKVTAEPRLEDVLPEERPVFAELEATFKRLQLLPAHEVIGVPFESELREIRRAYFEMAKRYHPDAYGRYRSPALRRLASELFIHVNRAYDRLREEAVRRTGASLPGPAARDGGSWMVDERDVEAESDAAAAASAVVLEAESPLDADATTPPPPLPPDSAPPEPPLDAPEAPPQTLEERLFGDIDLPVDAPGEAFDSAIPASTERAAGLANAGRAALVSGQLETARGHFAAALKIDPRNRPIRALYHVASGLLLRARGEYADAQLQFETALGHDPACKDALRALGRLKDDDGIFRRVRDGS